MSHSTILRVLCVLLFASTTANAQMCPPSEYVYYNGNILTGKDLNTPTPERVQAFAVAGGSITYIGTNEQANFCNTEATKKIDLHGAFVMPGFNDAHTHMAFAGQQRLTVDLDNVPSLAAMQAAIKTYAAQLPTGTAWITGGGWDHTKWASKTLPTRQDLDAITGNHPAYLERTDGHIAIVNTAALKLAGITSKTVVPLGGQIDLDPTTHEPTGILRESAAYMIVKAVIPPIDAVTRRRALQLAINDALSHGVTSVQDFSTYEDFQVLEAMEKEGGNKLPLRFAEWMPFDLPIDKLKQYQSSHPRDDPYLHTTMLKAFMDGSLGSRTATMAAPYSDDPKNSGLPKYDQKKLNAMTTERAEAGFQLGFHAIGDKANSMALTAFDKAKTERMKQLQKLLPQMEINARAHITVTDQSRYRIEHAQVLLPADFDRFAKLGIVASMQPSHLLTDMTWATDRIGPERAKYAYAWRSMLDHKITLAFGTDYPVESINPFRGLYAAITRQNIEGTQTFYPEQKLTLDEALYAYTQASAFAEFAETTKGTLTPNHYADFIVMDRDITKSTPREILQTKVLRTVVGGITRYESTTPATAELPHKSVPDGD